MKSVQLLCRCTSVQTYQSGLKTIELEPDDNDGENNDFNHNMSQAKILLNAEYDTPANTHFKPGKRYLLNIAGIE